MKDDKELRFRKGMIKDSANEMTVLISESLTE